MIISNLLIAMLFSVLMTAIVLRFSPALQRSFVSLFFLMIGMCVLGSLLLKGTFYIMFSSKGIRGTKE